jgi:hypothetical protein
LASSTSTLFARGDVPDRSLRICCTTAESHAMMSRVPAHVSRRRRSGRSIEGPKLNGNQVSALTTQATVLRRMPMSDTILESAAGPPVRHNTARQSESLFRLDPAHDPRRAYLSSVARTRCDERSKKDFRTLHRFEAHTPGRAQLEIFKPR